MTFVTTCIKYMAILYPKFCFSFNTAYQMSDYFLAVIVCELLFTCKQSALH